MVLEERKKVVWITESTCTSKSVYKRVGGALCVDPSGLLVTTVISTCPDVKNDGEVSWYKVQARISGGHFYEVQLVFPFLVYGVLVYQVQKKYESEVFDHINLESVGEVEFGLDEKLYAFIHEGGLELAFSYVSGVNAFAAPPFNIDLPDHKSHICIFESASDKDKGHIKDEAIHKNPPYRTVGDVVDPFPGSSSPPETLRMDTKLPLLQVSGLGLYTYCGQSGCPVFSSGGDGLLGLVLFTKGSFSFVLPVSVLLYCLRFSEASRKKKSVVGSSSRKGIDSNRGRRHKGGGGRGRSFGACGPVRHVIS